MPRAAIFDLDGTLADTLADIASAMNHALASLSLPTHDLAAYATFVGEGVEHLADRALPPGRADLRPALVERYVARYDEVYLAESVPYPGMIDLLDTLAARGIALAVLSNKPDAATQKVVSALFGDHRFVSVAGHKAEVPKKPDPSGALAIATRLGIPPADFIFAGDTAIDMQTAVAAGMIPVGVSWGFRPEELLANGARFLAATPADILRFL
jgi:phosphoglycolate phosphatase